jgi:enamine deaminase RidA (YjgF/YER057c/UK114 family)
VAQPPSLDKCSSFKYPTELTELGISQMDLHSCPTSRTLQPAGWARPRGYANGIAARGEVIFLAGLVGWDSEGTFSDDFVDQFRQTLKNTVAVLEEAGAGPEHIVRMTWYVVDMDAYRSSLSAVGSAYREIIGRVYPAMAVVQVAGLVEQRALLEIESTAVLP